jgi:UDP-N-acetylglucosamine acyltransferase
MTAKISPLAHIEPGAQLGENVEIGPFCYVGADVTMGARNRLDSHVTIVGHTTIGEGNRFFPNSVIGAEPQDVGYSGAPTRLEIGDGNIFREGVTVNRGAEKEDGCTRVGHRNMLMANVHVAHNCRVFNNVILVNGVLLGGHVHVHDGAVVSGNSVVHHFATLGTLSFVSGGCRCPADNPPYMLLAGNDDPRVRTVNVVGMRRAGISEATVQIIKRAHRLVFREFKKPDEVWDIFENELEGVIPLELSTLLGALKQSQEGKNGRAREAIRDQAPADEATGRRRAA